MNSAELLALFDELRVADVRDGMDWAGLHAKGTVPREIGPLFPGAKVTGIARTIRFRPTEQQTAQLPPEEYTEWAYRYWYPKRYPDPLRGTLQDGEVVVIESAGFPDVGEVGSNNSLDWHAHGARGVITSGGVRDTDECIHQGVPIFCRYRAQKMVQGRVEFDAAQVPVNIGGVLVRPGDIVVGDGDGLIVVPAEQAETVAKYARQELDNDKVGRRAIYEGLGWAPDHTVQ
ncbi:hypothetical protein MOQ72_10555 [Saccharopolyspora sp. K220]|uniref:RraA family protein n=1 Tax=Saccharopolyspora soli TaxID=2926618 RepID=UPI001F57F335|nr:hypothetical protein [Saccharopolyspora soli]MCI2417864.1 hypothetical protein [Saccharopolyspora soli]